MSLVPGAPGTLWLRVRLRFHPGVRQRLRLPFLVPPSILHRLRVSLGSRRTLIVTGQRLMRMSHLFGRTLREAPGDVELMSHQLMVRAAMVRPLGAGLLSLLPLGWRVVRKIEQIIREEMDAIGGQELLMPVVHPADIWKESRRWYDVGPELARFKDRADRDMVLAMTHEEVVTDLARSEISSYRQLPQIVYHLQTKFRDEPRSRGGLIRVREFTMKGLTPPTNSIGRRTTRSSPAAAWTTSWSAPTPA